MDIAQQRLLKFVAWVERNSMSRPTPNGTAIHAHGKFATIVPMDFAEAPPIEWHPECLPIFAPLPLADGLQLPAIDLGDSPSQQSPLDRLESILFRAEDYTLPAACGLFPLTAPGQPIQEAIDAVGGLGIDPTVFPVLAVATWAFNLNRRRALRNRLPFRPKPDAIDPPDGPWHTNHEPVREFKPMFGLKTIWAT